MITRYCAKILLKKLIFRTVHLCIESQYLHCYITETTPAATTATTNTATPTSSFVTSSSGSYFSILCTLVTLSLCLLCYYSGYSVCRKFRKCNIYKHDCFSDIIDKIAELLFCRDRDNSLSDSGHNKYYDSNWCCAENRYTINYHPGCFTTIGSRQMSANISLLIRQTETH